ncbi:DUF4145 domain-containing protein [Microbacterium halophytorum]|uniref:DUF4145 domain-containing protein n=1 Tax=Microbacterium halophytorum TaxID=2067568 RepID=UPI000CFAE3A5|nr:DUF4145 domain-containing protein [Microbacterium halophytorum]
MRAYLSATLNWGYAVRFDTLAVMSASDPQSSAGAGYVHVAANLGSSTGAFLCPRCNKHSSFQRAPLKVSTTGGPRGSKLTHFQDDHEFGIGTVGLVSEELAVQWFAAVCMWCRRSSVWRDDELIYPVPSADIHPHPDMPESAASLFRESAAVLSTSPRAAVALARASLETFLKHQYPDVKRKDLNQRVGLLHGQVRNPVWQTLTALRVVGNDALHDGIIAIDVDGTDVGTIRSLLQAVNLLVEELITQPAAAQHLYDQLPEAKRVGAEQTATRMSTAGLPDDTTPVAS